MDCSISGTNTCANIPAYISLSELSDDEREIALGNLPADEFFDEINYDADRELYIYLRDNPSLLINDIDLQNFYNECYGQTIGIEVEIERSMEEMYINIEALNSTIDNNTVLIELANAQREENLGLIGNSIDSIYIDSLNALNAVLFQNMEAFDLQNRVISHLIDSIVDGNIEDAQYNNNNLDISNNNEENLSIINDIYFETIAQGIYDFDNDMAALISSIAHQCPIAGGVGVYKARGLYFFINPSESYDDKTTCLQAGYASRKANQTIQNLKRRINSAFSLSPNPAKNSLRLKYDENLANGCVFTIFDMLGNKLKLIDLKEGISEMEIDISELKPALYFYVLTYEDNFIFKDKIAIIK